MCELVAGDVRCGIGAVVCEIIPYRESLERFGEGGAVIGKHIVEVSHFAITAISGILEKLSDDIVSKSFRHIQCPDNGTVFVVSDSTVK